MAEDRAPATVLERSAPAPLLVDDRARDGPAWARRLLALAALAGGAGLVALLLDLPERAPLLPELVERNLGDSGVANPVTAVLLNFRAYDTLLEVVVLVVAMVSVWSLDRGSRGLGRDAREREDPVLHALARLVVPLAGVTAVYLTWAGSHRIGGAFQAAALLAGAGVLLAAGGFIPPLTAASRVVRLAAALGVYAFVGVGLATIPLTGTFLDYPAGWAYGVILGLEAVLTVAIAVVLVELFVDVPAVPARDPALERLDPTGDPLGRLLAAGGDTGGTEGEGA